VKYVLLPLGQVFFKQVHGSITTLPAEKSHWAFSHLTTDFEDPQNHRSIPVRFFQSGKDQVISVDRKERTLWGKGLL